MSDRNESCTTERILHCSLIKLTLMLFTNTVIRMKRRRRRMTTTKKMKKKTRMKRKMRGRKEMKRRVMLACLTI